MGWRFRKSISLFSGVRLNIGKRGITSATVGKGFFSTNIGKRGVSHSINIPNTGISYRTKSNFGIPSRFLRPSNNENSLATLIKIFGVLAILGVLGFFIFLVIQSQVESLRQTQERIDESKRVIKRLSQTPTLNGVPTPSKDTYSSDTKTVSVKGYYRRDGTYVSPHTRSAPRSK